MKKISIGQLSLAALLISIISGFTVGYQYEVSIPLISTVSINSVLPWGWFWRSVHFWSSQAFVLLLCLHVYDCRNSALFTSPFSLKIHWTIISLSLPIAVYVLFSGYVLRFDATGQAAGAIAEHLLLKVPFCGEFLNGFLLDISHQGLNRIYIVHILFGFLCWLFATWYHLGRVRMSGLSFFISMIVCILFCLMIPAPLDGPKPNAHLIKGPWFFLGVQELLRYFQPVIAGILVPLIPVVGLALWPWIKNRRILLCTFLFWTIGYLGVTIMTWLR